MKSNTSTTLLLSSLVLVSGCDGGMDSASPTPSALTETDPSGITTFAYNADLTEHSCPEGMLCALNVRYMPYAFTATRLDSFWTDGSREEEPEPNCSSVLNSVYLDNYTYTEQPDGSFTRSNRPDGKPDDRRDMDRYQYHVNKEVRALDIYRPLQDSSSGRKVLFWIHGGAWEDTTREMYAWVPKVFTGEQGWVTVVVEYRQLSEFIFRASKCPTREACQTSPGYMEKAAWWPDPLVDVSAAFQWVSKNISRFDGDPAQIYVAGQSAGGNLASLLAVHPAYASLRSKMAGVITMSPPSNLNYLANESDAMCQSMYQDLFDTFFPDCTTDEEDTAKTGRPLCTAEQLAEASPTSYLSAGQVYPDFLVMSGGPGESMYFDGDMPCLRNDIEMFVSALQAASSSTSVTPVDLDGYGHVSEVASMEYSSADIEPETLPYGTYSSCQQPFGMVNGQKVSRNVTQQILDWVECGNTQGCSAQ